MNDRNYRVICPHSNRVLKSTPNYQEASRMIEGKDWYIQYPLHFIQVVNRLQEEEKTTS